MRRGILSRVASKVTAGVGARHSARDVLRRSLMSVYPLPVDTSPAEQLLRRALRFRRRGEARRALVAFREACAYDDRSPRAWTLYGVLCAELGRLADAEDAFERALWLRKQSRQHGRVATLKRLLTRLGLDRRCA